VWLLALSEQWKKGHIMLHDADVQGPRLACRLMPPWVEGFYLTLSCLILSEWPQTQREALVPGVT